MRNYIQTGDIITLTAPANLLSSQGFIVGSIFAIANTDALSGTKLEGKTTGVFSLPAKVGDTFAPGDKVYWVAADSTVTVTASTNKLIGVATEPVVAGKVAVRLNGVSLP